jgi:hypothetical protein
MNTILNDFWQQMAFFLNTKVMIHFCRIQQCFVSKKRQVFRRFFSGENIFKNHNIGPRLFSFASRAKWDIKNDLFVATRRDKKARTFAGQQ